MPLNDLMSTAQAAEQIGVNESRVRQLIRAGELHAQKYGNSWILEVAEVDRYKRSLQERNQGKAGRPFKA